jgi:hypothetical protein
LYLCFNQPLADHIARDVDAFQVCTFHKLCSDMVRAAGLAWRPRLLCACRQVLCTG